MAMNPKIAEARRLHKETRRRQNVIGSVPLIILIASMLNGFWMTLGAIEPKHQFVIFIGAVGFCVATVFIWFVRLFLGKL